MYTLYVKEKLHYVCAFCVMSYCFVCFCMYKYGLCRKGTVNTLRASNYYFFSTYNTPSARDQNT